MIFMLPASACAGDLEDLSLPEGFSISRFALGLESPRFMAFDPDGILHVTLIKAGKVAALPDRDGDGRADREITVTKGLNSPHGIAFYDNYLYVAETHQVVRFPLREDSLKVDEPETVVPDLPTRGGGHFTRTVVFSSNGQMYVSVGSSCNICKEKERERASVLNFLPDGSDKAYYAEGLRNTVGLAFHPVTGLLYGTENGRDHLGDDLPPDELNLIELGGHYGWPYCWGDKIPDTTYKKKRFCKITSPPAIKFQAHSAPLGLAFGTSKSFPPKYQGGLFVAFHGSWNRSVPTGYKVVYVPFRNNRPMGFSVDFVSGWLKNGKKWGRPVDVVFGPDGAMYISDDYAGVIYRVTYKK
jgi:glucose/arabinose dehydrogenase